MNIYKHEFKSIFKSVLVWSAANFSLILVFMSMFKSFSENTPMVSTLMESFPRELLIAFGMADMDWSTILGFFGLTFVFCQVCLAVQAANYGFALVSIEESEWTADFLLSKPVSRTHIMTSKLLAAITGLAFTGLVVWVSSFLFLAVFSQGQLIRVEPLLLLLFSIPVFQFFFLSAGMVISLLVKRVRSVTPFSMGLVFGLYMMNAFGGMIGEKSLEILSPFQHFAPSYIIKHAAWDMPLLMISVLVILLSLAASYILYARRDIASAI